MPFHWALRLCDRKVPNPFVRAALPSNAPVDVSEKLTVPVAPAALPVTVAVRFKAPETVELADGVRVTVDAACAVVVTVRVTAADELASYWELLNGAP